MSYSLAKRLNDLAAIRNRIKKGKVRFDPKKSQFGFRDLDVLVHPDEDSIKSYPCVVYNKDKIISYGVKVIPRALCFADKGDAHPADIEVQLLEEINRMIEYYVTPHITYYFSHFKVPNNVKALRQFPLKGLKKYIEPTSLVLIAEYVNGGSIETWLRRTHGSLDQWRYILFAVTWTLLVLQDRYRCIHQDLHYGNILLETKVKDDGKPIAYHLVGDDLDMMFKVVVPGVVPKLWDWEIASTFKDEYRCFNPISRARAHFPQEFDPHYDLHYFLTTLLEQNIPDEVVELIYELYCDDVIPSEEAKEQLLGDHEENSESEEEEDSEEEDEGEGDEDEGDEDDEDDEEEDDEEGDESDGDYYKTDDELDVVPMEISDQPSEDKVEGEGEEDDPKSRKRRGAPEIQTDYLKGERLLCNTWKKIENMPTPLSFLQHDFFKCYRTEHTKRAPTTVYRHIRDRDQAWKLVDVEGVPTYM